MVRALMILMLIFSLDLEARGGRRVGGGDFHPSQMARPAEVAHPAAAANRAAVRPLQRTPALSRAALNTAGLALGAGAAAGAGYDDDNQPLEIELSPSTSSSGTNQ